MKRKIGLMLALVFAFMAVLGMSVMADEEPAPYTAINVVINYKPGMKVSELDVRIFATTDEDRGNLTDRTDEFLFKNEDFEDDHINLRFFETFTEKKEGVEYWYENEEMGFYSVEIGPDTVIQEGHSYGFRIGSLTARNGADLNTWSSDVIMYNGVGIEDAGGSYGNTGNDLFLSAFIHNVSGTNTGSDPTDLDSSDSESSGKQDKEAKKSKCKVCGICPFQPLGICLFIWLVIIIVIVIVVLIIVKKKKSDDEDDKKKK